MKKRHEINYKVNILWIIKPSRQPYRELVSLTNFHLFQLVLLKAIFTFLDYLQEFFFSNFSYLSLSSCFISNCIVTNSCMGQATSTENTRSVKKNFHIIVVILKIEILTCFKSSWWNTNSYWICKHTNVDTTLKYIRNMPKWVIQNATSKVIGVANMEMKWTNPE